MSEAVSVARPRERVSVRMITYIGMLVSTVVAAVMVYQAYTYQRLFAWLAEWQFRYFDHMYPFATIALVTGLVALPFIILIVARLRRRRRLFGRPDRTILLRRDSLVATGLKYSAAVFAVGAVVLVILGFLITPIGDKPAVQLSLSSAAAPTRGLIAADGTLLTDRIGLYRERFVITGRDLYVAPLVPAGDDTEIRYFVQVPQREAGEPERRKISGILRPDAMPGGLRRLYENAGYTVGSPTYVIFDDARSSRWPFLSAASDLALLAFLLATCWLIMRRHLKQLREGEVRKQEPATPAVTT